MSFGHGAAAEQEELQKLASRRVVEHGMGLGRCQDLADDRPYVAGFGQGPAATSRPAAAKGKNRAASVPAASVATAMDLGYEEVVALPVSSGSRQSVNVQLPTAILRNLQAYLEYVHAARAGVADGAYGGSRPGKVPGGGSYTHGGARPGEVPGGGLCSSTSALRGPLGLADGAYGGARPGEVPGGGSCSSSSALCGPLGLADGAYGGARPGKVPGGGS